MHKHALISIQAPENPKCTVVQKIKVIYKDTLQ